MVIEYLEGKRYLKIETMEVNYLRRKGYYLNDWDVLKDMETEKTHKIN